MPIIDARDLDRRIAFQRPVKKPGTMTAGKSDWIFVAAVWAQVEEMLPSRGERMVGELRIALRPARIRVRYRAGITADMSILYDGRTLQIMAPPVELGRREGLELLAQDFSSAGHAD